jgi:formylglycine-generating enzyme required for sulfatase activity
VLLGLAMFALAGASATPLRAQDLVAPPQPAMESEESSVYLPAVGKAQVLVNPTPPNGAVGQSPNAYLAWEYANSYAPGPRFTLLLEAGDETPDVVVAENLARLDFDPVTFEVDTVYYWQVVVERADGIREQGPIWTFRTEPFFTSPPVGTMVTVPAGEFTMGCDWSNLGVAFTCNHWEEPLHKVWLDDYAIDKFEVTNGEYRACVAAGECDLPRRTNSHEREKYYDDPAFDLFPVIFVSRANALQYCTWAEKRLPTEAEWEKAARGPIDTRPYPWGIETLDCTRQHRPDRKLCGYKQIEDTARVGMYPRGTSPYGAMDMTGNVFEWVYDRFQEDWYQQSPYLNPINPPVSSRNWIVIRGGSYRDYFTYLRTSHRHTGHHGDYPYHDAPYYRNDRVGFRCARSLP